MRSVSSGFTKQSRSSAPVAHIRIDVFGSKTVSKTSYQWSASLYDSDIQDCTVKRSTGDSGKLTFGNCESAQCEMNILSEALDAITSGWMENPGYYSWDDTAFHVYFGYEVPTGSTTSTTDEDGDTYTEEAYEIEYVAMGRFYTSGDLVSNDYLVTTISAYDKLYYMDVAVSVDPTEVPIGDQSVPTKTYAELKEDSSYLRNLTLTGIDPMEYVANICSAAGVSFNVDGNDRLGDKLYAARPSGTAREMLMQFGELMCANGVINGDGAFSYVSPTQTGIIVRPEEYGAGGFTLDGNYQSRLAAVKVSVSKDYKYNYYNTKGKRKRGTFTFGTDKKPMTRTIPYSRDTSGTCSYQVSIENPAWLGSGIDIDCTVTSMDETIVEASAGSKKKKGKKKKHTLSVHAGIGLASSFNQDTEGRKYDADGNGTADYLDDAGFMAKSFITNLKKWSSSDKYYGYWGFTCDLNGLPQLELLDGLRIYDPMSFSVYPDLDSLSDSELYNDYYLRADTSTSDDGIVTRSYYREGVGTDIDGEGMRYYVESGDPIIDSYGNIIYSTAYGVMILEQEVKFDGSITQTISASSSEYGGEIISSPSSGSDSSDDVGSEEEYDSVSDSNQADIDSTQEAVADAYNKIEATVSSDTPTYLVAAVEEDTDDGQQINVTRVKASDISTGASSNDIAKIKDRLTTLEKGDVIELSYSSGILDIIKVSS